MAVPSVGQYLQIEHVDMILEAVSARQKNFPDEPASMSIMLVMLNIGDRFAPVDCVSGEWSGLKSDIPKPDNPEDLPKCPNGHVLVQGRGLKLGWMLAE